MKFLVTAIVAGLLAFSAQAEERRVMTVTGEGRVAVTPDIVIIHMGVMSNGDTAASAWSRNRVVMTAFRDVLSALKVDDKDVCTEDVSLSPRWNYPKESNGEPELVGYTASNVVRLTLHDVSAAGGVLDKLIANKANVLHGVTFGVSNRQKALDEARHLAVLDAARKAKVMTNAAGTNLGGVVSLSEHNYSSPYNARVESAAGRSADKGTPLSSGQRELSVTVSVTYELNAQGVPATK